MVSTANAWVYSLVSLFGLGVLAIIMIPVINAYVRPSFEIVANTTLSESESSSYVQNVDKAMSFVEMTPFILFIIVMIYALVAAIRREGENY